MEAEKYMKYASTISEIKNAFSPKPLKGVQMDKFNIL